jgi:hypothetical protein
MLDVKRFLHYRKDIAHGYGTVKSNLLFILIFSLWVLL